MALVVMILIACACALNNTTPSRSWTEDTSDISYTIIDSKIIDNAKLLKQLTGSDIAIVGSTQITQITYNSTFNGKRICLSGIVATPIGTDTIRQIVISNHWTIGSDNECPSKRIPFDVALCATRGVMVVCADYLGYGATSNNVHPYLCGLETARHSVDCFRAALQLCSSQKIEIASDYKTYNIGYSQGGAVALAVQHYIEANAKLDSIVHLEKTLCGAGPYDPVACYKEYLKQDTLAYPVVIPMIISGMVDAYPDMLNNINESDFFSDKFNTAHIIDSVKSKRYTTDQINSLIQRAIGAATPINLFSAEALDSCSELSHKLINVLELNNMLKGWTPKARLQFLHSTADVVVPIINYQKAQKAFTTCKQDSAIVANMGSHGTTAGIFCQKVLQMNIYE